MIVNPVFTPDAETVTSRVPDVIDWLVAAAASSTALGADPVAPVLVVDGPQAPAATQDRERVLWIGCDPAQLGDQAAEASQDWPVLDHGRTRDEDGSVVLACQHWSGDTVNKTHRDAAAAMVAAVELLLRGDGTTGPGDVTMGGLVLWAGLDGPFQWYQRQSPQGASALVTFRVVYRARLTTGGS